jgi:hypothetical protein
MSGRWSKRILAVVCVTAMAVAWSGRSTEAQGRAKRPLSYDAYDSWKSIQGTRLSEDGQWLAYAPVTGRGRYFMSAI